MTGLGARRSAGAARVAQPAPEAEPPVVPREQTTWVSIRLTDDADPPRPVARARYRITLPDGAVREGRLDAMGAARAWTGSIRGRAG